MPKPDSSAVLNTGNAFADLTHLLDYWPLNEDTGTIAANLGSAGVNATLASSAMWGTDLGSTIVQCGGTPKRVSLGTISIPAVCTVYLRFRTSGEYVGPLLSNVKSDSSQGFACYIYLNQVWWQELEQGGTNYVHTTATVTDGAWHDLFIVHTGSGVKIYLDGSTPATVAGNSSLVHTARTLPSWLGYEADSGGFWYNGDFYEAALWNYAFGDADVAAWLGGGPDQLLTAGSGGSSFTAGTIHPGEVGSVHARFTVTGATHGVGTVTDTPEVSLDGGATWTPTLLPELEAGLPPGTATQIRLTSTDSATPTPNVVHSAPWSFTTAAEVVPPVLYKTSARMTRWAALVAGSDWLSNRFNATVASEATDYSTTGSLNAFKYAITGDASYAAAAWSIISTSGLWTNNPATLPGGGNDVRQNYCRLYEIYTALYPWLDQAKRSAYQRLLFCWAEFQMGRKPAITYQGDTSTGDSDQNAAGLIGLLLMDGIFGTDYHTQTTFQNNVPVGGYTASADFSTMRGAFAYYCQRSAGGSFISGGMYVKNDQMMALLYAEAVKSVFGVAYLQEATDLLDAMCRFKLSEFTPDLAMTVQYGDSEHSRDPQAQSEIVCVMILAGLAHEYGLAIAPAMQALALELFALAGTSADPTGYWKQPLQGCWAYLFFALADPASANWRVDKPHDVLATGMGISMVTIGDDAQAALIELHGGNPTGCHHEPLQNGNLQAYRKGEWLFTNQIVDLSGYSIVNMLSVLAHAGLPLMHGDWGTELQEAGAYYHALRCRTSGQFYESTYYDPPAAFVLEHHRTLFVLRTAAGAPLTILVYDRAKSVLPSSVYGFNTGRYGNGTFANFNDVKGQMLGTGGYPPALKTAQFHALFYAAPPTVTGQKFHWATPGGQQVQIEALLPAGALLTTLDDTTRTAQLEWTDTATTNNQRRVQPQDMGYTLYTCPPTNNQFEPFLHVCQGCSSGQAVTNALVQSASGEAQGAHVQATGEPDALVLFGAQSGGRLLTANFSVAFHPLTSTSRVFLNDLDPGRSWTLTDNGAAVPLTVSSGGIGTATLTGVGARTLALDAGVPDTTPPVLSLPVGTPTSNTSALVGATTDEGNGTLYVVVTATGTPPTGTQIKAGQNAGGGTASYAASQSVSSSGAKTFPAAGLAPGTTYFAHLVQDDAAGNESNVVSSAAFTMPATFVPGTVSFNYATDTASYVTGTAAGGGSGGPFYQWQRAPDVNGAPGTWANLSGATGQNLTDSTVPDGHHRFWYRRLDTDGVVPPAPTNAVQAALVYDGAAQASLAIFF